MLLCRRRRIGHNSWLHGGSRRSPEQDAWLHPSDMQRLGLSDGDTIAITTSASRLEISVRQSHTVPKRAVVVPHGLADHNVNALFSTAPEAIERLSGMVTLTGVAAEVHAVRTDRRAQAHPA